MTELTSVVVTVVAVHKTEEIQIKLIYKLEKKVLIQVFGLRI
jgi:hypothetical protein